MNPAKREMLLRWMNKNIAGCEDPRAHGDGCTGNHCGEWRYRIGDYRVLCEAQDSSLVVLALNVDHRSIAENV